MGSALTENTGSLEGVAPRLTRLEAEARRRDRLLVLLFLGLVGVGAIAGYLASRRIGTPLKTVTHSLVITDEQGATRAWVGVNKDGPGVSIFDDTGHTRIWVGLHQNNPSISILGADDKARVTMGSGSEQSYLLLQDDAGKKIFSKP